MKVEILRPSGFCNGVKLAFDIVKKAKNEHLDKTVFVLGLLVHNDRILSELEKDNIKTVFSIDEIPDGQVVVFPAHGHTKDVENIAKKKNLIIYDAICPKVKYSFSKILEALNNKREVIYIGVKGHQECETALSLGENIYFYDVKKGLEGKLNTSNPVIINQTTLNFIDLNAIHKELKEKFPCSQFLDEICDQTRVRQNGILRLDKDVDLIIVLGDIKSSNTTRLFELSRILQPNIKSIIINSEKDLNLSIIKNKNHIVIASGTSTPDDLVDTTYNLICNY